MSSHSLVGKQIDEYRLEEMLGEGGMASVYRALDVRLKRYVAVKVIRTSLREQSEYSMRFEREAQAIGQLEHPNIITLYRFGESEGLLFMAMQYIDGADLAAVIESFHSDGVFIEFKEIIRLAHEIGTALDYAHSKGVIHRDIKPNNIMIEDDGRALVTDFGLALMTEIGTQGEIFGTPHYIAPEQAISSAGVVPQSDLYAMGVILYEMLTGDIPFDAAESLDIAMMHMSEPVPSPRERRPELSEAVEQVLLKALEKDPADRYASGKALAEALEAALEGAPQKPRTTITSKVAVQREANPLPPIPAAVTPAQAPPQSQPQAPPQASGSPSTQPAVSPPTVQRTAPEKKNQPLALYALGGIIVVLLLIVIVLLASSGGDDNNVASSSEDVAQAGTLTQVEPSATATIPPSATATVTLVTAVPTTAVPTTAVPTTAVPTTAVPTTAVPTTAVPSSDTTVTPAPGRIQILSGGSGLTDGSPMNNGEFQVEGYCLILNPNYGADEDGDNWYCTLDGERVQTLVQEDFRKICVMTYGIPEASAIQLDGNDPAAYRWRCVQNVLASE